MTHMITDDCVDVEDATCVGECPVDSICGSPRSLYVHMREHGPLATDHLDVTTLPQTASTS